MANIILHVLFVIFVSVKSLSAFLRLMYSLWYAFLSNVPLGARFLEADCVFASALVTGDGAECTGLKGDGKVFASALDALELGFEHGSRSQ